MPLTEKENKYYMTDNAMIFYNSKTANTIHCHQHEHDFVEMVYMLKGSCTHIVDEKEYHVKHGDLVIVNYNQTHGITGNASAVYVNILIKPGYINKSLTNQENAFALLNLKEFEDFRKILDESKCKVTFSGKERDMVEDFIAEISKEMNENEPGYELAIRLRFNLLMLMIFRKMSLKLDNSYNNGMTDDILNHINNHLSERLTLNSVAALCSYNTSYFSRVFKDYTGMTFTAYLRNARIEKAAELLLETDMRVTDIIYDVGYSDKTKFFAHFKALKGETPLNFRKRKNK